MEKLRLVYSKSKEAIYLSHIDIVKVFEESFLRANIKVKYSYGNSRKAEFVFAHPLSIGIESVGEIVEVDIVEKIDTRYIIKELNNMLPSGITILTAEYVDSYDENIMSRVYAATYCISIVYNNEKLANLTTKELYDLKLYNKNQMNRYLEQEFILVLKKSNERMERIDIKPQIHDFNFSFDGNLEITIDAGSKSNLKPEYILSGFNEYIDEKLEYNIKRTKILFK